MGSSPALARGAALSTLATAVSRATGFVRVVVVAAAMGTTFLANTYQTANTAPNLVFELIAAGVLTSIFVPTFVGYLVKERHDEGWDAANALTSVALMALIALSLLVALLAPAIMRVLTLGVGDESLRSEEIALGSRFLRLFSPQIALYGAGMIMTGALHAHRRFVLPAVAPIFNNVVVIGVYLAYALMRETERPTVEGITDGEVLLLGAGTTAGVLAMTVCLIPQLRTLGWRYRFHFSPSHPAVKKGARLGLWALGYAGGYQAGLIVVLMLANKVEGGVAAYQWAFTFFYLPHALFAVPIFNVLFTAMSEHVARSEQQQLVSRLDDGLSLLLFILVPVGAALAALAIPLSRFTLQYGSMTQEGADLVARVLLAFALGLPAYSAFLVFTRAFYATGDARTPALVNAASVTLASALGAILFFQLPERWSVAGLALGHSIAFTLGAVVLGGWWRSRLGRTGSKPLARGIARTIILAAGVYAVMVVLTSNLPDEGTRSAFVNVLVSASAGAAFYLAGSMVLRAPELGRIATAFKRVRK